MDISTGTERFIAAYKGLAGESPLPELCRDLFARQKASWHPLGVAYENLRSARRREIPNGDGSSFFIQFNPARIGSAEARIDAVAIGKRPCFLCPDRLPPDQKGIRYRESFAILCNPFPIFVPHFTIVHDHHLPQAIEGNLAIFLEMARDFGPAFSLFYNGPRCGASAPDHLHFQASPAGAIPIEKESLNKKGAIVKAMGEVAIFAFHRPGRQLLLLEGASLDGLASVTGMVLAVMRRLTGGVEEAMVNIIAAFGEGRWRIFIFPRTKHRPDAFFRAGDARRAITPGAVEMGGLVITTNDRDFTMLDKKQLIEIFTDVSADRMMMRGIIDALFV